MPHALNGAGVRAGGGFRTRALTRGELGFQLTRQTLAAARGELQTARAAGTAIALPPLNPRDAGSTSGTKLAFLKCQASGGSMILGRCVKLGGADMPIRANLLASGGFLPTGSGAPLLGQILQGGFDVLNTLVAAKFGGVGVVAPTALLPPAAGGVLQPAGGIQAGLGIAVVGPAIIAAGGRVVGSVIQISRAAWAAIPSLIKQAAIALGLTVAFTDIEVDLLGGGGAGMLSQAQQRKIAKFQAMTSAGVPPNIAARATSIGKRRRRGISAFELRGFSRISHMLSHWGMVPKGLSRARVRHHHHSK